MCPSIRAGCLCSNSLPELQFNSVALQATLPSLSDKHLKVNLSPSIYTSERQNILARTWKRNGFSQLFLHLFLVWVQIISAQLNQIIALLFVLSRKQTLPIPYSFHLLKAFLNTPSGAGQNDGAVCLCLYYLVLPPGENHTCFLNEYYIILGI